jgi:DNA (cytosine-5)-methyltransferase 1
MTRLRLLDAFCCEGGAAVGYARAGFEVFGVDVARAPLRRYPFAHHRGDAVQFIREHGAEFDAIHASPPCKIHTVARSLQPIEDLDTMLFPQPTRLDLVPATRAALAATGRPWVMENVPNAGLLDPVMLCGSMFGLGAKCSDGWRQLRRHRMFETNWPLVAPGPCEHRALAVSVFGGGGGLRPNGSYYALAPEARAALGGVDWMSRQGAAQALPPVYTQHIGTLLLAWLETQNATDPDRSVAL